MVFAIICTTNVRVRSGSEFRRGREIAARKAAVGEGAIERGTEGANVGVPCEYGLQGRKLTDLRSLAGPASSLPILRTAATLSASSLGSAKPANVKPLLA
jgi:hypothetical protein